MSQHDDDQLPPFMDFGSVPAAEMPPFATPAEVRSPLCAPSGAGHVPTVGAAVAAVDISFLKMVLT
jgi:hypothetical protein